MVGGQPGVHKHGVDRSAHPLKESDLLLFGVKHKLSEFEYEVASIKEERRIVAVEGAKLMEAYEKELEEERQQKERAQEELRKQKAQTDSYLETQRASAQKVTSVGKG